MAGQDTFEYSSKSETEDALWVDATFVEVGLADGERITVRVPSASIDRIKSERPKTRAEVEDLDGKGI